MRYLLSLSILTAVLVGTPALAYAQNSPRLDRPARPQLNLTEAQRQQMQKIRENTQQQMQAVLTPEQRARLESARQAGQSPKSVMRSLNLTPEQQERLRAIRQRAREQRLAVLTPEQRAQLEQFRQNRPNRPGPKGRF